DAVSNFQTAVRLGGAARNKTYNLGVAVFRPEHRADTDEGEPHINTEVFQVGLTQIFGMRVVRLGERVEKELHLLVLVLFMDIASETFVTARDQLRAGLDRMFAEMFLKQLTCNP